VTKRKRIDNRVADVDICRPQNTNCPGPDCVAHLPFCVFFHLKTINNLHLSSPLRTVRAQMRSILELVRKTGGF
jgi:hypothetical protein